jgi:DNA-binding NarL/FixJ family response regulator
MIRLLVVEDNANIIVPGLRSLLRPERDGIHVACVAESADEALRKGNPDEFDMIILDLWLSVSQPLDNLLKLQHQFKGKPILVYTQDDSPVWRNKMLNAGASAYLTKNTPRDELKSAIVKVSRGDMMFIGQGSSPIRNTPEVRPGTFATKLSPVQRRMVELLTHGASREEIAATLSIHASAVDKSFAKLRLQFQCKTNYELIRILMDNNLL